MLAVVTYFRLLVAFCAALGLGRLPALAASETHSTNNPAAQELKKFQLGSGLKLDLFASEPLLQNPVAFSIDAHNRFYVAETHRWSTSVFDITANTPWLLDDLSCRTVNDRASFLSRTFATNLALLTKNSERIKLVEDRNHDGHAETSSTFADGFNQSVAGTAAGVLAQSTNVWFTCIPDLWRMSAASPTNTLFADKQVNLATGFGVHISVSGHDVHGLIRGPDGRIYFSFGDRGVCVTNREGKLLNVPDTGGVLRCEPDGRDLEIFCVGLRNPQELAFDDLGNLWTVDNDTAGADPCRVLHLLEGADYGWRGTYQHMKGFGPWVQEELWRGGLDGVLPPAGTVSQGPAGLAFYPGTGWGDRLSGKFVHADFPGGIWAFSVKPRGASFEIATKEKLLWNCWPTDVDFGPDGALYVLDWVEGWTTSGKGRIYRLSASAPDPFVAQSAEVQRLLSEGMNHTAQSELLALLGHRDRRVRLEAQWALAERGTNSLMPLVSLATENRPPLQRIHALWGIGQLLRILPANAGVEELAALLPLLEDADPELRGQAALVLGEGLLMNAEKPVAKLLTDESPRVRLLALQAATRRWRSEFTPAGPHERTRTFFSSKQAIVGGVADKVAHAVGADRMKTAELVGATVAGKFPAQQVNHMLNTNRWEPFLAQAATHFLVTTRGNHAFESHVAIEPSVQSTVALIWALRRTQSPEIRAFLTHADERIVLEAARAINDEPVPAAYPELASLILSPRLSDLSWGHNALSNITPAGPYSAKARSPREQVILRSLNANFRLGDAEQAQALVHFATGLDTAALRAEALYLLGAWEVLAGRVGDLPIKPKKDPNHGAVPTVNPENWPGWFDRIVGLWRPLPPRSAEAARAALSPSIRRVIFDDEPDVALAAINAVVKLNLTAAGPALLERMRQPSGPLNVRQRIPGALAALDSPLAGQAVQLALSDPSAEVRAAALPHLDRLQGDQAATILGGILQRSLNPSPSAHATSVADLRMAQAAFNALRTIRSPEADALIRSALTSLLSGGVPAPLELDVLEAAETRRTQTEIRTLLDQWAASLSGTNDLASWRPVLAGGDAQHGREIFLEKVEVQCARCHRVKSEGGTVGPSLDGIASRQTRPYLLESILRPNRVVAPGFESVLLTLKSGSEHAGLIKSESDSELRLDSPEEGLLVIRKSDIVERRRSLSAMPEEIGQALTKRELRDLIEFLGTLK